MKNISFFFIVIILLSVSILPNVKNIAYCKDTVHSINCHKGYITNINLPSGDSIIEVINPQMRSWITDFKFNYVVIVPKYDNLQTNITVFTKERKMYVFSLFSDLRKEHIQIVNVVECGKNLKSEYNSMIMRSHKVKKQTVKKKRKSDYKVFNKNFDIESVYDDKIFTYIQMPKSQFHPAIFFSKSKKLKKGEPVRYLNENGKIIIYRVLKKKEYFILRFNDTKNYIRRKHVTD